MGTWLRGDDREFVNWLHTDVVSPVLLGVLCGESVGAGINHRGHGEAQRIAFQVSAVIQIAFGCFRCAPEVRCFHAGLLGAFAAEPERARREFGDGWHEQAERLGRGWEEIAYRLAMCCALPSSYQPCPCET